MVEDCSENMGGSYMKKKSGSQFDVSTFSLYANKTITSGEGGVVCSSDSSVIERCNRYKNLDFPVDRNFVHEHQAYNFRMASPLAALAYSQLCRIDEILENKQKVYEMYVAAIDSRYLHPLKPRPSSVFVPWMNCFKVAHNISFDYALFAAYMRSFEIQIRPFFSNLARQVAFINKYNLPDSYPATDNASALGFYLPSALNLNYDDICFISDVANRYFQ
jgi:perosamine synthetase